MAHDVFISHSSKDKPTADAVCAMLESQGIRCWVAPRDITPGMEFAESIIEAINSTRIMVLMFSSHANQSPQVRREVERAVNKAVVIIPVRIEDIVPTGSMEYYLSTPHWLDAFTPPLQKHFDKLVDTIKAASANTQGTLPDQRTQPAAARAPSHSYDRPVSPQPHAQPISSGYKNIKAIGILVTGIVIVCLLAAVVVLVRTKAVATNTAASQSGGPLASMFGISQAAFDQLNPTAAQMSKLQDIARAARATDLAAMNAPQGGGGTATGSSGSALETGRRQSHERAMAVLTSAQIAQVQKFASENPQGPPSQGGGPPGDGPPGGGPPSGGGPPNGNSPPPAKGGGP